MNLAHRAHAVDLGTGPMRSSSIVQFAKVIGATGVGTYLGAATAGIGAIVTGAAFDGVWLAGIPGLAILGACLGALVAPLTGHWLLPQISRRGWVFTGAGLITMPLIGTIGNMDRLGGVLIGLVFAGGLSTVTLYLRSLRARRVARAR